MTVQFNNLSDFLNDLRDLDVDDSIVRCAVAEEPVNDGLTMVALIAGFRSGGEVYTLELVCGQNIAGDGQEGTGQAEAVRGELQSACDSLGLQLRGGEFDRG